MQPLQCDSRLSDAKHNSIAHAAAARSNHDAAIPLRSANIKLQDPSFGAKLPSNSKSWRDENEAFVRGFLQIPRVEEMKMKLSCEAPLKFYSMKRWKRRFRAKHPSNAKSWRDENEAFVRGFLQIPRVEEMKTKLGSWYREENNVVEKCLTRDANAVGSW